MPVGNEGCRSPRAQSETGLRDFNTRPFSGRSTVPTTTCKSYHQHFGRLSRFCYEQCQHLVRRGGGEAKREKCANSENRKKMCFD